MDDINNPKPKSKPGGIWDFTAETHSVIFYTFWTFVGIAVLILIGAIIWRIVTKDKDVDFKGNKRAGTLNKKLNDVALDLSNNENFLVLYNIIIKNKYAQNGFSLIPIIIIRNGHLFIFSNLIDINQNQKLKITNDYKVYKTSNSLIKKNEFSEISTRTINLKWYNEILKFIKREISDKFIFHKTIITSEEIEIQENKTQDYNVIPVYEIAEFVREQSLEKNENITDYEERQYANRILKLNQFKEKINRK